MFNYKQCLICHALLTDKNDSKEHILLESLGDTNPVSGIICEQCNNILGTVIDQGFEKPLKPLADSLTSEPTKIRMRFTGDGREYLVMMKDGKIDEQQPYKAVKSLISNDATSLEFKYLNFKEAEIEMKKMERRFKKKGIKTSLHLTKNSIDPNETGDHFVFNPDLDIRYLVLETMKMQAEYLYQTQGISDSIGAIVLREIVKRYKEYPHKLERKKQVEAMLTHIDPWLIALFNVFQMGNLLQSHSSSSEFEPGVSKIETLSLPNQSKFTGFYLFGKIALWIPVLTFSNLLKMFGPNFIYLFPSDDPQKNLYLKKLIETHRDEYERLL